MSDVLIQQQTPIFLFIEPLSPTVANYISVVATPATVDIKLMAEPVSIYREIHVVVQPSTISLEIIQAGTPYINLYTPRQIRVDRRTNRSAWQARLGSRLDPIKRKLLDNNLLLSAHPTDMIRVRAARDSRTQDILSRSVVSNEVLPILLPVLKDIPIRKLQKDDLNKTIITSFAMLEDGRENKPFEAYCPLSGQLQRDDLLFRIIKDPYAELPHMMVLQVKDELATLAYSSILYTKYLLSFYDEALPQVIVDSVLAAEEKRGVLQW